MNGMTRKKLRIANAKRYTSEGVPRDPNEWTVNDWRELWRAMKRVVKTVGSRNKRRNHVLPKDVQTMH